MRKDKKGQTALMLAIEGNESLRADRMKLLLASGADARIKNKQGQTALMLARKAGLETIVKLLEDAAIESSLQATSDEPGNFPGPRVKYRTSRQTYPACV
jgi:ankyrin repeat protein